LVWVVVSALWVWLLGLLWVFRFHFLGFLLLWLILLVLNY